MPDVTTSLRTPNYSSAPASPTTGQIYYDTTTNRLYVWNGTIWVDVSSTPSKVIWLTSGTTYTPSAGVRALYVEAVGGGGAGGGAATSSSQASIGAGGGAGAFSAVYLTGTIKSSYSYVIGAGGTGVTGATGNNGSNTTFDSPSVLTANGGSGGPTLAAGTSYAEAFGGSGGLASNGVGDLKINGGPGYGGIRLSASQAWGGDGGETIFGGGGTGRIAGAGGNGGASANAFSTGAGGGGAGTLATQAAGGAGVAGIIKITEFF